MSDETNIYTYDYFQNADGKTSWNTSSLKFGDALATLAYAHGITYDAMMEYFPEIFNGSRSGRNESHNQRYIDKQLDFLDAKATRRPKHVLEIGGGRGEVAAALHCLGVNVTSVEPGSGAKQWYRETGEKFFGNGWKNVEPINLSIDRALNWIDISSYDTIIMVESLEHIPEEKFNPVWNQILKKFHGLFIAANWIDYHPIAVGQYASPQEHCRLVDDALYDLWTSQAKQCIHREGSHIVLEF